MIRKIVYNTMTRGKFRIKRGKGWEDPIGLVAHVNEMILG